MDTVGVILAASTTIPGCSELFDLVNEAGGKEESTILAFGRKVPAWMAAFANGAMGHGLDYDDLYRYEGNCHPGAATIPAALAIAERMGKVSGRQFLAAVAVGEEIIVRLSLAVKKSSRGWKLDWHLSPVLGVFGACAAAGKLLDLNREQMVDAFGIALNGSAGTMELAYGVGSNLRGMYPAFPGIFGTLSSLMAQRGITGVKNSFEGKAGLFNVYFGGAYNRDSVTSNLGKEFEISNLSFKAWPACGGNHCYIDAALDVVSRDDISPHDIVEIKVFVGKFTQTMCEPLESRRKPLTPMDAKFSLPFNMAVAAARRELVIRDFLPENLHDPLVLELAQKVTPVFDQRFDVASMPALVEIRTKGGSLHSKQVDVPYGDYKKPMSSERLLAKFRDCASYSAKPISSENLDRAVHAMTTMDEMDNATDFVGLLS